VYGEGEVPGVRDQVAELGAHGQAEEGQGCGSGEADFGAVGWEEDV